MREEKNYLAMNKEEAVHHHITHALVSSRAKYLDYMNYYFPIDL
jgi:hypothetical protein